MEEIAEAASVRNKKGTVIKALVFIGFIIAAIYLVRFTPAGDFLKAEKLGCFLNGAGVWAPVVFMAVYAAGICLFVPGTVLTGLGAAIFGPYRGFLYAWIGAMVGASVSFFIGRSLGRDFTAALIQDRLKRYDDAIERNGVATVFYLRLIYFPFAPMNFGMGLTSVKFRDYFSGTGLGIIVGTFVCTFFIGTVKGVWASGNWGELVSFKVLFYGGLFIFSIFIPKIIMKVKGDSPSVHK